MKIKSMNDYLKTVVKAKDVAKFWGQYKTRKPKAYGKTEMVIYDFIEDRVAKQVNTFLRTSNGRPVTIKINSWGGDVFAGFSILNDLLDYEGKVTTKVQGMAASAAALIFMGGDKRVMSKRGMLMFHKAWNLVAGNADDLRQVAKVLDKIDDMMVDLLDERARVKGNIKDFLSREEFLNLAEAKKMRMAEEEKEEPEGMDEDEEVEDMDEDDEPEDMEEDEEVEDMDEDEEVEDMDEDEEPESMDEDEEPEDMDEDEHKGKKSLKERKQERRKRFIDMEIQGINDLIFQFHKIH